MRVLEPRIVTFIADRNMYVLRDARTQMALNVSFTPEGLSWTTDSSGRLVRFENGEMARVLNLKKSLEQNNIVFEALHISPTEGELRLSDKVYVEKFVPFDHQNRRNQVAECLNVDKAYRLLTRLPTNMSTYEA